MIIPLFLNNWWWIGTIGTAILCWIVLCHELIDIHHFWWQRIARCIAALLLVGMFCIILIITWPIVLIGLLIGLLLEV
jgi:hypothetical protein